MDDFRATPPNPMIIAPTEGHAPRVRSDELLRGSREIVIEHRGQEYRLLRTRNDRLILNK
ncbi:MAG TPA: hemin uptake protein HemP [Solimonas sp.]|jgi:hemin uptake protein HemP|nr:hemin uptake protein HemP [Solimonas sp.]